jgi:hypothetical protein
VKGTLSIEITPDGALRRVIRAPARGDERAWLDVYVRLAPTIERLAAAARAELDTRPRRPRGTRG